MKESGRINGLDALRGVAMVLGVLLHATISYKRGYHYGNWVFDREFTSWFFDWLYLLINSFRMQTFFLLAGFFSSLLIKKNGLISFSKNRVKRIGLVLILSYFTILPLTLAPYLLTVEFTGKDSWNQLMDFYVRFYTFHAHSGFMHLWFLQHLLIYYGLFILSHFLISTQKLEVPKWISQLKFNERPILFLVAITVVLVFLSQLFDSALPSIWTGFVIPLPQFLYYLFFFVLGWWLENQRNLFGSFVSAYKPFLFAGIVLNFLVLYLLNFETGLSTSGLMGLKSLFSVQTMLLVIGSIGLFMATFKTPSFFWSYIADSAYWVYLIHMPIVLIAQLLLVNSSMPGVLKFPIVIFAATLVSFGSYHVMVRYTWIGTLLRGRKMPG